MLEANALNHHYGSAQVLHEVSFAVSSGEIVGLLGPNGAGKSTTMRILTGYLTPSSGSVRFDGLDVGKKAMALRKALGYMPENVPLYPELRVREYLHWAARVKNAANPEQDAASAMERCGLGQAKNKLIRHLSKGYQQRVGLAQAVVGPTRLLILDEPTVGLDPNQIREIRNLIKELGKEKTILLSTHILPEVELTCDRVLVINQGRIVAEDTPSGLAASYGGGGRFLLRLESAPDPAEVQQAYASQQFVLNCEPAEETYGPGGYVLEAAPAASGGQARDVRGRITALAFDHGWPVLEFKPAAATLEDAFVNLVRGGEPLPSPGAIREPVADAEEEA